MTPRSSASQMPSCATSTSCLNRCSLSCRALGPILQPELPALVRRGVAQCRAHEPAEEAERLGVAVAERARLGGHDLEDAEGALLVGERRGEEGTDADGPIGVVPDAGIREQVVGALQLAGADAEAGEAVGEPEARRVGADVDLGDQLLALDGLDDRAGGAGEAQASVGDHPHHRSRVEARRRHRLLDLDHRLEELGVEPHGLLGQLALGDVELGAEVADLAARLVAQRLPAAGRPAHLAAPRHYPVLLIAQRAALRQPLPFRRERGPIVRVDVLEELLVPDVFLGIAGEPLEGPVHEGEPQAHVVSDDALPHRRRNGSKVAARLGGGALRAAALQPHVQQHDEEEQGQHAEAGRGGGQRLGRNAPDQTSERGVHEP